MQRKILISILSIFLLSIIIFQTASAYVFISKMQDDGTINRYAKPPSFYWGGSCVLSSTLFISANSSSYPYTANHNWYMPDATNVQYSNPIYNSNIVCLNAGTYTASSPLNTFYESETSSTSSATIKTWIQNVYTCQPDSNDLILYDSTSKKNDSFGNYPYSYAKEFGDYCGGTGGPTPVCSPSLGSETDIRDWIKNGYYSTTTCGSDLAVGKYGDSSRTGCSGGGVTWYFGVCRGEAVSFNSGSAGLVNITLNGAYWVNSQGGGTCTFSAGSSLYLWDTVLDTLTLYGSSPITVNFNLIPNRNYWLIIPETSSGSKPFGAVCGTTYNYTSYNISISAYIPNLNCSEWSSCSQGVEQRTCNDLNMVLLPYVETRSCFEFANQSIFLGFEQGDSANVWYCAEKAYDLFYGKCERSPYLSGTIPNQKSRVLPKGWYRGGQFVNDTYGNTGWIEDYVDVDTSDYYTADASTLEGALKLWYIPSKPYLPIWNESGLNLVVCNSTSEGQIGSTYTRTLNQSFWVSQNITSLSPYMTLSFRTKKCAAVMPQTLAYWPCTFSCGLFGNCADSGLCNSTGDDYYTWNGCSQSNPKSTIGLRLRDITLGADLALVAKTVSATDWDGINSQFWEYNINDMNINHTYEVSFSAPPVLGVTDNDAYCVLVDDVNINFRSTAFSCAGSDCSSEVDYDGDGIPDYTYVEVTPISGTACSVRTIPYDYRCVPANVSAKVKNYLDWCDGTTQHHFNNETGLWETATNNPTCIAEQEAAAQQNSYTTPMTGDTVVNTVANLVAMPIFFSFIIAMGIGAYVAKETKFWQIGVIFSLGLMTVFSLAGMFPIWFLFIVAIFAIAMFAYMMKAPAG